MNKKKTILGLNTRNLWSINPRTRIHDNNVHKNNKKLRQAAQRSIIKELAEN